MTRLNVGASDKDSLIQDTQEFNGIQPYLKPPQNYLKGWIKAMYQMVLICWGCL